MLLTYVTNMRIGKELRIVSTIKMFYVDWYLFFLYLIFKPVTTMKEMCDIQTVYC